MLQAVKKQENISGSMALQLPTEIVREILKHLLQLHPTHNFASSACSITRCQYMPIAKDGQCSSSSQNKAYAHERCLCWQLDILSASTVCKSWYYLGLEMMRTAQAKRKNRSVLAEELSWISLVNEPTCRRTYPFRTRLVSILRESYMANLVFHKQVHHLVIDFASFDSIRRERAKPNNAIVNNIVHHSTALKNLKDLLELCINVERLDIVFDAGLALLTPTKSRDNIAQSKPSASNCILANSVTLQHFFTQNSQISRRIKRLEFVGFNPDHRCPCCAGKEWDRYLSPLLSSLTSIETITLRNVLPTAQVFQTLSNNPNLQQIIFHRAMVTLPMRKRKKRALKSSLFNSSSTETAVIPAARQEDEYVTSIQQIPAQLWLQVKSIKIYEDAEDVTIQKSRKYLNELALSVGSQLEEFVLQFGTKEDQSARGPAVAETIALKHHGSHDEGNAVPTFKPSSPLFRLKIKCKDSLKHIMLINVPEI